LFSEEYLDNKETLQVSITWYVQSHTNMCFNL
jgi:hypothetical protein